MTVTPAFSALVEEVTTAVEALARIAHGKISVRDEESQALCEYDAGPGAGARELIEQFRVEAEPVGTIAIRAEHAEDAMALVRELLSSVYRRRLVAEIYQDTLSDSYEVLLAKNQRLERLTQSLEKEVEERTRELDQAHAHLAQESRITALHRLAAGLAHELNTPLACVRCNLETLPDYRGSDEDGLFEEVIAESVEMIDRVAAIVSDLLGLAHTNDLGLQRVAVHEELERLLRCFRPEDGVQVVQELADTPPIEVDAKRLGVALLHVLENACDAASPEGIVHVRTSVDGDSVMISIADDGAGMTAEVLEQAFDPFFTTKPVGSGVGLGLTVSRDIVKMQGGRLDLESAANVGTTVTITLPIDAERTDE